MTPQFSIPNMLNTSNLGKQQEFRRMFSKHGHDLVYTTYDLQEIQGLPVDVVIHKANYINNGNGNIIVEDTSLDVEGADIGINVKWLINTLENYVGKKAVWRVLLAFKQNTSVFISEGTISGSITSSKKNDNKTSNSFGFDPYFIPEESMQTLAEFKPDEKSARAIAVDNMMLGKFKYIKAL